MGSPTTTTNETRSLEQLKNILGPVPVADQSEESQDHIKLTESTKEQLVRLASSDKQQHQQLVLDYLFGEDLVVANDQNLEQVRNLLEDRAELARATIRDVKQILILFHSNKGRKFDKQQGAKDPFFSKYLPSSKGSLLPYKSNHAEILKSAVQLVKNHTRIIRTDIAIKSLTALRQENRPLMLPWLQKLSTHNGSCMLLKYFLQQAGTFNPYVAREVMRPRIKRAADLNKLPEDAVAYETENDATTTSGTETNEEQETIKTVPIGAIASSGAILTKAGNVYLAYRDDRPESVFLSRRQSIMGIYSLIQSQDQNQANNIKEKEQRVNQICTQTCEAEFADSTELKGLVDIVLEKSGLELLEDLTLSDLEEEPTYEKIARKSPILGRQLALYKELRAEIAELKNEQNQLLRGEKLLSIKGKKHRQYNIIKNPTGNWLSAVKTLIEDPETSQQVPDTVKLTYEALTDKEIELPQVVEAEYTRFLFSWIGRRCYVEKDLALSDLLLDIECYKESAKQENQTLYSSTTEPSNLSIGEFLAENSWILDADTQEISLYDAIRLQQDSRLDQWRAETNKNLYRHYQTDIDTALEYLRPYFQAIDSENKWQWHEDSSGQFVPAARLSKTLLGTKIKKPDTDTQETNIFLRDDWHSIREILDLEIFAERLDDSSFESRPVAKFKSAVFGLLIAFGKAKYCELSLQEDGIDLHGKAISGLSDLEVEEITSEWNVSNLLLGGYDKHRRMIPAGELKLPAELGSTASERLKELAYRAEACFRYRGIADPNPRIPSREKIIWHNIRRDVLNRSRVGLVYDQESLGKTKNSLEELARSEILKSIIPVSEELSPKIELALKLNEHPCINLDYKDDEHIKRLRSELKRLIPTNELYKHQWFVRAYITPDELSTINKLWPLEDAFNQYLESDPQIEQVAERAKVFLGKKLYRPSSNSSGVIVQQIVGKDIFTQSTFMPNPANIAVSVSDIEHVKAVISQLEDTYIAGPKALEEIDETHRKLIDRQYTMPSGKGIAPILSSQLSMNDTFVCKKLIQN